jgi:hypothetical protein
MPEPHLRASDADRAAVATVLGSHMSAGRLTVAEYDERLTRAYAARTYGELAELTTDLPAAPSAAAQRPADATGAWPAVPTAPAQQVARHGVPACGSWGGAAGLRAAWLSWASTAAIVLTVWLVSMLASGDWVYPWPVWVIGPWGAVLLAQSATGRGHGPPADQSHGGLPPSPGGVSQPGRQHPAR